MISPEKLFQIEGGQRRRKLALCFGALERDIAGIAEPGCIYDIKTMPRQEYTKKIATVLLTDPQISQQAKDEISALIKAEPFDERRLCNVARNHLLAVIGTLPAEWDLVIAPHNAPRDENGALLARNFYEGVQVFAEDIRSPFNLGSIFRSAEAFGAEKVLLSPFCTDPNHPRAIRSAMGCIESIPWERTSLDNLPDDMPVFALETGGTPIDDFVFPRKGIVILGSEELGCSPKALARATYGCVTIPMTGIKASLNVGVAFGVLMSMWMQKIRLGQCK